jgi:glycosyltransferase involved in cell wall biosynthesis
MISVCMASFNGSKYIEEQLKSILSQLAADDEVVIVDDSSQDDTVSKILSFNDPRINLVKNDVNCGVITSFERSIRHACGDFIFLSDQDDVWLPGKVNKIMELFTDFPAVTLCLSDALIIDEFGEPNARTYFETRGSFKRGILSNIIKNRFLGCAIAFKKSTVSYALPIPSNIPAHDMWIGLINEIYGKTIFIKEPLFHYRRHSYNVSSMTRANIVTMMRWRFILIYQLSLRALTVWFRWNRKQKTSRE